MNEYLFTEYLMNIQKDIQKLLRTLRVIKGDYFVMLATDFDWSMKLNKL